MDETDDHRFFLDHKVSQRFLKVIRRICVTPAGFMVEDQMFDRKLRKLAYGFLRVSLLRSDSVVGEVGIFFYYKNNTPPERRCRS